MNKKEPDIVTQEDMLDFCIITIALSIIINNLTFTALALLNCGMCIIFYLKEGMNMGNENKKADADIKASKDSECTFKIEADTTQTGKEELKDMETYFINPITLEIVKDVREVFEEIKEYKIEVKKQKIKHLRSKLLDNRMVQVNFYNDKGKLIGNCKRYDAEECAIKRDAKNKIIYCYYLSENNYQRKEFIKKYPKYKGYVLKEYAVY